MRRLACIGILFVVVSVGCSESARYRLKHWFFDIPEDTPVASQADEELVPVPTPVPVALVGVESAFTSLHPPYVSRECRTCHDASQRMQPRENFLTVCRGCHERYFGPGVGHFPVSEGQCTTCHDMHRSGQAGLLKMPMLEMCVECHDEPVDLSEGAHNGGEGVDDCIRCHDPHFGKSPLLKRGVKAPSS